MEKGAPDQRRPLVSALVAAYNPGYLHAALHSVLGQSYDELELIVVDDSPGDAVKRIVDGFPDPRVRYVRNNTNLGTGLSYRRAIELASGELIAVINDDDVWDREFLETLVGRLLEFPQAVVAFADHWVMRGDAVDRAESDRLSALWGRAGLGEGLHQPFRQLAVIDRAISIAIASVFRREAVVGDPIPADVGGAYDLYLAYVLSRTGAGAVYLNRRLSSWRVHETNQTKVRSYLRAEENAAAMRLIAEDPAFGELRGPLSRQYGESLWTVASRNLRYGSDRRALAAIGIALRHRYPRPLLLLGPLLIPGVLRRQLWP